MHDYIDYINSFIFQGPPGPTGEPGPTGQDGQRVSQTVSFSLKQDQWTECQAC